MSEGSVTAVEKRIVDAPLVGFDDALVSTRTVQLVDRGFQPVSVQGQASTSARTARARQRANTPKKKTVEPRPVSGGLLALAQVTPARPGRSSSFPPLPRPAHRGIVASSYRRKSAHDF